MRGFGMSPLLDVRGWLLCDDVRLMTGLEAEALGLEAVRFRDRGVELLLLMLCILTGMLRELILCYQRHRE